MEACIERGCRRPRACCPAGLSVRRRAPAQYADLTSEPEAALRDPLAVLDWVNLYALAVNEENAAGGRVVTAPTNGAAGVIPAVLAYYVRFVPGADDDGVVRFLLTAGAIGDALQGERLDLGGRGRLPGRGRAWPARWRPGACAPCWAARNEQVENAAEIGMEHNLGLTCDPIGGLVQIPCIERNTMGAVKAINAARLAPARRRQAPRPARQGDRDHARDRPRHAATSTRRRPWAGSRSAWWRAEVAVAQETVFLYS